VSVLHLIAAHELAADGDMFTSTNLAPTHNFPSLRIHLRMLVREGCRIILFKEDGSNNVYIHVGITAKNAVQPPLPRVIPLWLKLERVKTLVGSRACLRRAFIFQLRTVLCCASSGIEEAGSMENPTHSYFSAAKASSVGCLYSMAATPVQFLMRKCI
jgi:hypothetical protein